MTTAIGFMGLYCLKEHFPLNRIIDSSMLRCFIGIFFKNWIQAFNQNSNFPELVHIVRVSAIVIIQVQFAQDKQKVVFIH